MLGLQQQNRAAGLAAAAQRQQDGGLLTRRQLEDPFAPAISTQSGDGGGASAAAANDGQQQPPGQQGASPMFAVGAGGAKRERGLDDPSSLQRFSEQMRTRGFEGMYEETANHPRLFDKLPVFGEEGSSDSAEQYWADFDTVLERKARALLACFYGWNHRMFPKLSMKATLMNLSKGACKGKSSVALAYQDWERGKRLKLAERKRKEIEAGQARKARLDAQLHANQRQREQHHHQQKQEEYTFDQRQYVDTEREQLVVLGHDEREDECGPIPPPNSAAAQEQQQQQQQRGNNNNIDRAEDGDEYRRGEEEEEEEHVAGLLSLGDVGLGGFGDNDDGMELNIEG